MPLSRIAPHAAARYPSPFGAARFVSTARPRLPAASGRMTRWHSEILLIDPAAPRGMVKQLRPHHKGAGPPPKRQTQACIVLPRRPLRPRRPHSPPIGHAKGKLCGPAGARARDSGGLRHCGGVGADGPPGPADRSGLDATRKARALGSDRQGGPGRSRGRYRRTARLRGSETRGVASGPPRPDEDFQTQLPLLTAYDSIRVETVDDGEAAVAAGSPGEAHRLRGLTRTACGPTPVTEYRRDRRACSRVCRPAPGPGRLKNLEIPQPIYFDPNKVFKLMAKPKGRRPGYHTTEQVSNPQPPDSRPCVLTTYSGAQISRCCGRSGEGVPHRDLRRRAAGPICAAAAAGGPERAGSPPSAARLPQGSPRAGRRIQGRGRGPSSPAPFSLGLLPLLSRRLGGAAGLNRSG